MIFESRFSILGENAKRRRSEPKFISRKKAQEAQKLSRGNFSPPSHRGTESILAPGLNPRHFFTTKARSTQSGGHFRFWILDFGFPNPIQQGTNLCRRRRLGHSTLNQSATAICLRPLFTSAFSAIKMARRSMPVLRAFVSSWLKGWRSSRGGAETRSNLGRSTSPRHFFTTEAPSRSHSSALGPIPRHF